MDNLAKRWAAFRRHYPFPCPLQAIGYLPEKTRWLHQAHPGLNISLILRGGGEYHLDGKCWAVEAPCVMVQFPDAYCEYGPSEPYGSWDELYLSYLTERYPLFEQMRMVDRLRPVWPIHSLDWITTRLREIDDYLGRHVDQNCADWLDREMHQLLFEALQALKPPERTREEVAIYAAYEWVQKHLHEPIDWDWLAREHGMSPRSFRRYWVRSFDKPPASFLTDLRISAARRMLVETSRHVQEIAEAVGVEDALYFSRLFRKHTGMTPTECRRQFEERAHRESGREGCP